MKTHLSEKAIKDEYTIELEKFAKEFELSDNEVRILDRFLDSLSDLVFNVAENAESGFIRKS